MALVTVTVGARFDSYEELAQAIELQSKTAFVQWVKSDCKTVESANKSLAENAKKYDGKFKYRYVKYQCKHGGQIKSKSLGIRPRQKSFKRDCPAKIYASVDRDQDCFVILKMETNHNHQVSGETFSKYPEQRRLSGTKKKLAETMLGMKVKVRLLQDHIQTQGKTYVTVKDLHNIRQKMRITQHGNKTEEEVLLDELEKLGKEDPDSELSLQINDQGVMEFLLIVTGEMKQTFEKYPEVLMVDGTYRVNKLKMPLYNFLVEDAHGLERSVGFCLVSNEKNETVQNMMNEISKVHDCSKIQTIVVDKDLNEITALKKVAPNSSIQLCKFHVIQAVNREIRKLPVDQATKLKISGFMRSLIYSKSQKNFDNHLGSFARVAPKSFMDYINKNWIPVLNMWVAYLTNKHVNLGNTTNNRMESFNQKVKDILDHTMSIPESIRSLLLLHRTMLYAVNNRQFDDSMKVPYLTKDNDEETDNVMKSLTPYAAKIVMNEISVARNNVEKCTRETCKCTLSDTMGLPCRHIFVGRITDGTRLFESSDAIRRWHLDYDQSERKRPGQPAVPSAVKRLKKSQVTPVSKEEKYKDIMYICKQLADLASSEGTEAFCRKHETLEEVLSHWKNGDDVLTLPLEEEQYHSQNQQESAEDKSVQTGNSSVSNLQEIPEDNLVQTGNSYVNIQQELHVPEDNSVETGNKSAHNHHEMPEDNAVHTRNSYIHNQQKLMLDNSVQTGNSSVRNQQKLPEDSSVETESSSVCKQRTLPKSNSVQTGNTSVRNQRKLPEDNAVQTGISSVRNQRKLPENTAVQTGNSSVRNLRKLPEDNAVQTGNSSIRNQQKIPEDNVVQTGNSSIHKQQKLPEDIAVQTGNISVRNQRKLHEDNAVRLEIVL